MKKLIFILCLFITTYSFAQDVVGSRVIARQSLFVRDWWIDSVRNDTTGWLGSVRSIGTLDAIYKFVVGRVGSGGGGGGGTWGSITGTLSNQTDLQSALDLKANIASPTLTGSVTLSALAGNGNGFVAVDNAGLLSWISESAGNLIVQNAGTGQQIWYTSGDTLYMKKIKNATISATTDTDSSLLLNVTDADRGDITVSSTGTTWTIDNTAVTFAKIQNLTQARLLGRYTASTGSTQEISLGSGLSLDAGTGVLSATGGGITIGTTTITSGTNTRILYNNSGVVGEYTLTGTGTVVPLSTSPDFTTGITIGSVAVPTISSTNTLTNKRWTARVGTTTSSATPTINTDNTDIYKLTAQTTDITSFTTNLSGTPVDGDILEIQVTGTATRNLTFGSSFVSSSVAIPTATSGTITLTIIFQYFTTSSYGNNKWVAVNYF